MRQLKRVLTAGWLVSVSREDGSFTRYAHEAKLRRELAVPTGPVQDAGVDAISQAIGELRTEPGYRVLLVDMGGRADDRFVRWISSEASGLSPVYVSDGGKTQVPTLTSEAEARGKESTSPGDAGSKKERMYSDGVFHEVELEPALRHVFADRRFEYDVRFRLPESASSAEAPVKLTFLDPETHLPYELRTSLYSVETSTEGGVQSQARAAATERLIAVER